MSDSDIERRLKIIDELNKKGGTFAVIAVCSVYWFVQSLRWGTSETTAVYWRLAGIYAVLGCSSVMIRKSLTGELSLPSKLSLDIPRPDSINSF